MAIAARGPIFGLCQELRHAASPEGVGGLAPTHLPPSSPLKSHTTVAQRRSRLLPAPHRKPARRRGAGLRGEDGFRTTGSPPVRRGDNSCQENPSLANPLLTQHLPQPPAQPQPLANIQITPILTAVIGCGSSNQATPPRRRRGR